MEIGNAAKPALSFQEARGSGIWHSSAGQWRLAVNGSTVTNLSAGTFEIVTVSTIRIPDGTAALPILMFSNDTDTGIFRSADDALGISVNGTERFRVSNNRIAITGTIARC